RSHAATASVGGSGTIFHLLDEPVPTVQCRLAGAAAGRHAHRRERGDTGAMTEIESLIAEVRQLRADVARLHAAHTAVHMRHGWMSLIFKDLSTNPYTQYKVHMWGAIYWLINFPLICCLFFFTPTLWLKLGIFITLISPFYPTFAPASGAWSGVEAALGKPQPPPIP